MTAPTYKPGDRVTRTGESVFGRFNVEKDKDYIVRSVAKDGRLRLKTLRGNIIAGEWRVASFRPAETEEGKT